jgi:enamine deaminase RidA (YjgF/YER057c/UK114 family)
MTHGGCFSAAEVLDREGMTLDDVCFVHLYVYDMSAFGAINAEYCRYFGQYMPPSRSCVEVASIAPTRVLMDCFALRGSGTSKRRPQRLVRDVLHVKSISCWAPHCIGPYSQANILHCSLILLAGQIALLPQTMGLVGPDHQSQGKQSFVNAGHALEALDSNLRHVCSAVIYATRDAAGDADLQRIRASSRDQLRQNAGLYDVFEHAEDSDESDDEVDKGELLVALVKDAPLLVVQVSHLPRSALVEVELQALTHKVVKHLSPRSEVFAGKLVDGQVEFQSECSMVDRALCLSVTTAKWTGSGINSGDAAASVLSPSQIQRLCDALWSATTSGLVNALVPWDRVFHTRVFYVATAFTCELELAAAVKKSLPSSVSTSTSVEMPALTFVPVEHIQHGAQIAVQVLAQDLDKLETELWLRKQV